MAARPPGISSSRLKGLVASGLLALVPAARADTITPDLPAKTVRYCQTLPAWQTLFAANNLPGKTNSHGNGKGALVLPDMVLEAAVNGNPERTTVQAVCHPTGRLMLLISDWNRLRFRPTLITVLPDGQEALSLESIAGGSYQVNDLNQTIDITAPAEALFETSLQGRDTLDPVPPPPPPGIYLNYDATASFGIGASTYAAALEAVAFNRFGLMATNVFVRDSGTGDLQSTRGDTYWQKAFPDQMTTLTMGDTVGVGGAWSRPVRFGGIRYARDFGTRPGFVTFPMPSLTGSAALPSTVEVLINNQQRLVSNVPAGPFDLKNIPITTGAGQMQLVVRDLLGREQIITQNYYMSPRLLTPGLSDFSFEAGWLRRDYGGKSDDYGAPVLDGTYRWGLGQQLTAEVRSEVEEDRVALGGGLSKVLGSVGVVNAAAGYAASKNERGGHYVLGFDTSGRAWSGTIGTEFFDSGYRQFAEALNEVRPQRRMFVGGGLALGAAGNLSANYVYQSSWDGSMREFLSAGWNKQLLHRVGVGLSASTDLRSQEWSIQASISLPLGPEVAGSASLTHDGQHYSTYAEAASPTPTGPGLGWRVRASTDASDQVTAGGSGIYNTLFAQLTGDIASSRDGTAVRLGAAGAVGRLGSYGFATRPIHDSFAIVRTGDIPDASVLSWNQLAAVTDRQGVALVTNLSAYQRNKISIDPAELPMDVEIDTTEMEVRAWPRSGVFVDFPMRRTRNALVVLRLSNGQPVPSGARVTLPPAETDARVAQRGEVWLTDLADVNRLHAQWKDGACWTTLTLPQGIEPGARISAPICTEQETR